MLVVKICLQCRRPRFHLWVGKTPGEGNGKPLQYSCLENSMDRGGLQSMGSQKRQTWLSTHTGQDIILRVWPQMEFWSWEMLSLKIILQETLYPYFLKFHRVHLYVKGSCNKEIYISLLNLTCRRRQWHPTPVLLLENPMDGGAWWAAVHGVSKSRTRLSDFTLTFHFHALEKEMATHSSVLAWRIPGTGEPGGLLSMGSYRVGNDWSDLAAAT